MIKIRDIIISNLFIGSTQVSKVYLGNVKVWPITTETNYVIFTAQQDNSSIGLNRLSTNQTLEYSTDAVTWNTFNTKTNISLNTGDKVYVRGKLSANNTTSNYTQFKMSGKIAASGNTNSLWDYENPDTQLKKLCGRMLFSDCTGLTVAPELPATTLADFCYGSMFQNCTSLTTAPELPATELASYCYQSMFYGCTSLTTAPELPATVLASDCYNGMFQNCTSLTTAPELPATTLANYCYYYMFYGCTSLTTAPVLPATILTNDCYYYMFYNCTSLTTAPELPATELANSCYKYMFNGCTSLNYIKCLAVNDINTNGSTYYWVAGVASTGTFVKDPNATSWTIGNNGIPTGWVIKDVDTPYVTFTAKEDNSSIGLTKLSTNQTLEYSTDTVIWNTFNTSTNISLNNGDKVYVRGKLSTDNTGSNYTQFKMSGKIAASGNTNSLWNYEDLNAPLKQYCGCRLFYSCSSLTSAPELHATTLADYCYLGMFYGCTSLTKAPELPAITLANNCYDSMFYGCTSLTTGPSILPATELASNCYSGMFDGCSALTTAPELPATTLANNCYQSMFRGCTSLTTGPSILPANTLESYCYNNMFQNCRSLTTAPELPATTLAEWCYAYMFFSCTSLNYIKCLAANGINTNNSTIDWLYGVSSNGTFVKASSASWHTGSSGIPSGWTTQDA